MNSSPRLLLRDFYDRALLSPDLLCLSCAHTAWNRSDGPCSNERREDCILFVSDMVNRLAAAAPGPERARGGTSHPRP